MPFQVGIRTEEGERQITEFTEDPSVLQESGYRPFISIRENQDVSIRFQAPGDARFIMDGFDVAASGVFRKEEQEAWLPPGSRYVTVFTGSSFPLVPGYYAMKVECGKQTWYAGFEIRPRHMEESQWQAMRDELTEDIRMLSFDFMKRNMKLNRRLIEDLGISSDMLFRFYAMNDMAVQVLGVLDELSRTANSRVTRVMERTNESAVIREQERISGWLLRRPAGTYPRYMPRKRTTWDVPENRFAKKLFLEMERYLRIFIADIDQCRHQTEQEEREYGRYQEDYRAHLRKEALRQFEVYRSRAERILTMIRLIAKAPWFEETGTDVQEVPSTAVFVDPRYRVLYRLSKSLRHPAESLSTSPFYEFQWKRTDKLYELWCFLQFIKAMTDAGWEMEKGLAVRRKEDKYILENMDPGTVISLVRGEEKVRLSYDARIPDTAAATSRDTDPVFTNNPKRRPDCRLDYYCRDIYCGTLIADFKYRNVYRIWNEENSSSDIRLQFNAYRDVNTKYYLGMDEEISKRDIRPVKEVWAVFPKEISALPDEDYNLRFISLAPGLSANGKLPGLIEDYLGMLKRQLETEKEKI